MGFAVIKVRSQKARAATERKLFGKAVALKPKRDSNVVKMLPTNAFQAMVAYMDSL